MMLLFCFWESLLQRTLVISLKSAALTFNTLLTTFKTDYSISCLLNPRAIILREIFTKISRTNWLSYGFSSYSFSITHTQVNITKGYKNIVLICRDGASNFWKLLPFFDSIIHLSFSHQRYAVNSLGTPTKHLPELGQLKKLLLFPGCPRRPSISYSKKLIFNRPVGVLKKKGELKSYLKRVYKENMGTVTSYFQFLSNHCQQKIVALYRNFQTVKALKKHFISNSSVQFLHCTDPWKPRMSKTVVIVLQPFLKDEVNVAKPIFIKMAIFSSKIEYYSFDSEKGEGMFVYPDILSDWEVDKMRKNILKERNITVYFDTDETGEPSQIEIEESTIDQPNDEQIKIPDQPQQVMQPKKHDPQTISINSTGLQLDLLPKLNQGEELLNPLEQAPKPEQADNQNQKVEGDQNGKLGMSCPFQIFSQVNVKKNRVMNK